MEPNELTLALCRLSFLTCREKVFLAKNLDNIESLTVLSIEDLGVRVGRIIRTRCWKPEYIVLQVESDLAIMRRFGIGFVSFMSSDYPPLLREMYDPPFGIFRRGELPDPEHPLVAIVGTRSPSGDGALAARKIAREFGEAGIPVVSGLARGIDAFAHRGNLDGRGASIAVLACGVDCVYPRSNACLAARMVESGGCLLSEYPPGETPLQSRFPERNRIISGLARSVLVVEAPMKSGALITADFALEQGRDLFVCADTLSSARGEGTRRLHEQGAPAIRSASTILETWGIGAKTATGEYPSGLPGETGFSVATSIGRQLAFEFSKELALHEGRDC